MPGEHRRSVVPAIASILFLSFFSGLASPQQSVQTNQTDLDFTNRLASETDRMQRQVRELSARVSALEVPSAATQSQMAGAGASSSGAAESLRHRDGAVYAAEFEEIKATLGSIDYKVVQERMRIDATGPADADQQTASVNQLRELAGELQQIEDVVARLESESR